MILCPCCKEGCCIRFNQYLRRPQCIECGWIPTEMIPRTYDFVFQPCDNCWGYKELQVEKCHKCQNKGRMLNLLGEEIAELVRNIILEKELE